MDDKLVEPREQEEVSKELYTLGFKLYNNQFKSFDEFRGKSK